MTTIINSRVPEFKVQAFHNGQFIQYQTKTSKVNGLFSFSILPISPLFARPSW